MTAVVTGGKKYLQMVFDAQLRLSLSWSHLVIVSLKAE